MKLLILLLATFPAQAQVITHWEHKGVSVPVVLVDSVQAASASEDEFAIQLGGKLRSLTADNGFEYCAQMCRKNNVWGAVITTIKSHAVCPVVDICPDGFTATAMTIHSHVHSETYAPNDVDRLALKNDYNDGDHVHTSPNTFSPQDFLNGAGYMVSKDYVWKQEGLDKVTKIAGL